MTPEAITAWAAVASAVGTVLATLAAFRSAGSAQSAQDAAAESERRFAVRELCLAAGEVLIEFLRVEARAIDAKQAYTTLFVFSGGSGGSRKGVYISAVEEKVKVATELRDHANLFVSPAESITAGPLGEIDRIHTKLMGSLTQMRALREDLEREYGSVEGQNAVYREKVIQGLPR